MELLGKTVHKVGLESYNSEIKNNADNLGEEIYERYLEAKKPTVENLHLDPMAEMFVFGCTVDYIKELGGSYLKVINPNAKASCGCGESFAV